MAILMIFFLIFGPGFPDVCFAGIRPVGVFEDVLDGLLPCSDEVYDHEDHAGAANRKNG